MANKKKNDDEGGIISGVIDQVSQLTIVGREVAADFVETISPDTAIFIRPASKPKKPATGGSRGTKRVIPISSAPAKKASKKSPAKKAAAKKPAKKASASKKPAG